MSPDIQIQRDHSWIDAIRSGDERAFEEMFHFNHASLVAYAATFLHSGDGAREVVQEVFLNIWQHRANWKVHFGLRPYLFRAVRNRVLDYQKRKYRHVEVGTDGRDWGIEAEIEDHLAHADLQAAYVRALAALPERRRTAFVLHREHGLSCAEIAHIMTISERTVEHHIGKALSALRHALADLI